MSAKYHAFFSVAGQGSTSAPCTRLEYGPTVRSEEDEGRFGRAFYPRHVTSSSFSLGLMFTGYEPWRAFNAWMEKYSRAASDPDLKVAPMLVSVPQRNFIRSAIPSRGFQYGDTAGDIAYRITLSFEGASEPVKPGDEGTTSEPDIPTLDEAVVHFYPTGFLEGDLEDGLYSGITHEGVRKALSKLPGIQIGNP